MSWVSWRNSGWVVVVFVAGIATGFVASPLWKAAIMHAAQPTFAALTYRCDHAMREHLLAKARLGDTPSTSNVRHLEAAEVGLIDCQDYDLMRKRLIRWGLSENELSEMALTAIEERASTLHEVVRIHEIRY